MGKILCHSCKKTCKKQAIRLEEKYFHLKCFICNECKAQLPASEFYTHGQNIYCCNDYQRLFGTKCRGCDKYVEGNVVTVNGQTYHENCFMCYKCSKRFEPGEKVTFAETNYFCNDCIDQYRRASSSHSAETSNDADAVADEFPQDGDLTRSADDAKSSPLHAINYGKFYQASYLDKVNDFKRGPSLNPSGSDRSPRHYHRPENFSYSSVRRDFIMPAKKGLVTDLECETSAPKSEMFFPIRSKEPIRLARLPDAHPSEKNSERGHWSLPPDLAASYRDPLAGIFATSAEVSDSVKAERGTDAVDSVQSSSPARERPQSAIGRYSGGERVDSQEDVASSGQNIRLGLLQSDSCAAKSVSSSCDGINSRRRRDSSEDGLRSSTEEFDPTTGLRRLKVHPFRIGTRRSVPCLFHAVEAPKIYGYCQLKNCQDHLPPDVEWVTVEHHLSKDEFEGLFHMSRDFFYQLAEWKRNDMKARVGLF